MTPLDQAAAFAIGLAELVLELTRRGYRVVPIEVGPLVDRVGRDGAKYADGVHGGKMLGAAKWKSRHYDRCAADLLVYRKVGATWVLITDGEDVVWPEVAAVWAKFDLEFDCTFVTGIGWGDPGHVSVMAADGRK